MDARRWRVGFKNSSSQGFLQEFRRKSSNLFKGFRDANNMEISQDPGSFPRWERAPKGLKDC